ncbi:hypothetical protein XHC_0628 [Xanthomonas hortorum pv. carotae str. M081]|nr:hypothetical protein XHC_0628 [Xanthomonas hortorum pv. carotae str. M081]
MRPPGGERSGFVGRILLDAVRSPDQTLSGSNARCPHRSRDTPRKYIPDLRDTP